MSTFLTILMFVAIGALIGFLGAKLFQNTSLILTIILGLLGSFGASWVANLLGLGAGVLSFSIWGLVFGVLGACLFVGVYGLISRSRKAA